MNNFVIKCEKCGVYLDDDIDFDVCPECDLKEEKTNFFNKKSRTFKKLDNKKETHRTKKRQTKPRKEVIKDIDN